MVPPPSAAWWRRVRASFGFSILATLLAAAALLIPGCDGLPLTAPNDSTIDLVASSTFVPLGGSAELTAIVTESSGTPVHNGTSVTFTTTLGRVEPAQAHTTDGRATARLHAGGESGIAFLRAFSGSAVTEDLEVRIGAGAAAQITLVLSPSSLPPSGGTADVIAFVTDEDNRALANVPVTFSATAGTLRDTRVTTNASGEARTTITTTRDTDITASVGDATDTETLTVSALPTISVTVSPSNVVETDEVVTFTITVTPQQNGNPVRDASISFGDGTGEGLGALDGTTQVTHQYTTPGTFTVRITVTDTAGERVERVLTITAEEPEDDG